MKIEYKNRLVAFIDVLGFKNLVYSSSTEPINTYYSFLLSNFQTAVAKRNFDFLLISDSIVIYSNDDIESLSELIKLISILQAGLLAKGVIVRGAISHGELFVDKANNIIVGTGLINAYNLEAQAKYPRVIIDRLIVSKYYGNSGCAVSHNIVSGVPYVIFDSQNFCPLDYPYLNYGRIFAYYSSTSNTPLEKALTLLKNNYYKNEQIEKFEWLRNHIIKSLVAQIDFLMSIAAPSKNGKTRLRICTKYLANFTAL
jgi:MinD-like ATPase involved in chromosome partitioning or flagellar assembly